MGSSIATRLHKSSSAVMKGYAAHLHPVTSRISSLFKVSAIMVNGFKYIPFLDQTRVMFRQNFITILLQCSENTAEF
jgi:hypothetical protein